MDCAEARDLLLRSEGAPAGPLAAHLGRCDGCARLASDLAQLESAWRAIPLPAESDRGRRAFLDRLATLPARPARRSPRRWLVAASVLLALGLWGGVLASGRRAGASTDVVERLVDWNLDLAGAGTPAERGRLYDEAAPGLASEVELAALPEADRELADALLASAPRLARDADPLADADHLDGLADRLLRRIDAADPRRAGRYARLYRKVAERGVGSKLETLQGSPALDFDRAGRLERLVLRDAGRMDALVALLERAPDSSRKEIKAALGIARKPHPKGKKSRPAAPILGPPDSRNPPPVVSPGAGPAEAGRPGSNP